MGILKKKNAEFTVVPSVQRCQRIGAMSVFLIACLRLDFVMDLFHLFQQSKDPQKHLKNILNNDISMAPSTDPPSDRMADRYEILLRFFHNSLPLCLCLKCSGGLSGS